MISCSYGQNEKGSSESCLLVALPWHKPDHMSIQIGGLKAYLSMHGLTSHTRHYYKDVLAYIPEDLFYHLYYANVGEYLSLCLLFPKNQDLITDRIWKLVGSGKHMGQCCKVAAQQCPIRPAAADNG